MKRTYMVLAVAGLAGLAVLAFAASSANYILDPVVIDQGGGEAWSVTYAQPASIGGNVIGSASSPNYLADAGFAFTVYDDPNGEPVPAPPLLVLLGAQTPGPSWESGGVTGLSMIQIKLSAGISPVIVSSLEITASGTGNDSATTSGGDIFNVHLYADNNSNGLLDATDTMLSQNKAFSGDDGTVTFGSLSRTIASGASEHWIVVGDFLATPGPVKTFQFSVADRSDVTGTVSANPITIAGPPFSGYTKSFNPPAGTPGSLTASATAANSTGVAAAPGEEAPVFHMQVSASSLEPVVVTQITFITSGTGNEATDVVYAWLYNDANANGSVDPGEEIISGPVTFTFDNDPLVFNFNRTINANASQTWMVVYRFAAPITPEGLTFRATINSASSITARGFNSTIAITPAVMPTAPLNGPVATIVYPPSAKPVYFVGGCAAPHGPVHPAAGLGALLLLAAALCAARAARRICFLRV